MKVTTKLQNYCFASAICIGATMLSWISGAPSSCFHLAIVICSLYGEKGAGLFALGLSILSFDYFFLPPHFHFSVDNSALPRFAAFIATAVCINVVIAAKRRGDRKRHEVEEQYQMICETALDAVLSTDDQGQVLLVNSSAARIFGYSRAEMMGQPIERFVPRFCRERSSSFSEITATQKDGTEFVAEVSVGRAATGNKCSAVIFVRDITERKRAEDALRTSESYLTQAQRLSLTGSFGWDVSSGSIVWSAETFRIAGVDPEVRPTLQLIFERVHPEDRAAVKEALESSAKRGVDLNFEHRFVLPDASVKFVHVLGKAVHDRRSHLQYIGAAMDVTAHRTAEEMLRRSEARYRESEDQLRKIIDTIPVMAWSTGPDGKSNFMNQRWLDYTGSSVDQDRRENFMSVFHPDDAGMVKSWWLVSLASGVGGEIEARMRRVDGEYRWFLMRSCPLCDEHGNVVRWYGTNTDIEDLKAARDSLQKTEERLARAAQVATLGEVSASIAHEINQPLTAIIANAHMCFDALSTEPVDVVDARSMVQDILEGGYHATGVVRRMRTLFKGGSFEKASLDINEVAREVIDLIRSEAGRRRVELEIDLEEELPPTLGDRVQIQQVLVNLCINGFDAMDSIVDRRKKLSLRTRAHDPGAIRVEVEDSGMGLLQPERVFEPFFTTKEDGMGMGLPISRSIIELHDGRLWPQNGITPGTTFCFTLPVPENPRGSSQERAARRQATFIAS